MDGKLVIISAPSGSGKSTIVGRILPQLPKLKFSISATSRSPRGEEKDGEHYYFHSPQEFRELVAQDAFIEWEEVYPDTYYGTLKREVNRLWDQGNAVVFDIDVVGGLNLKEMFAERALSIFIQPPSVEELENRLRGRGTDSEEKIQTRLGKAKEELARAEEFDVVIVNDDLEKATTEAFSLMDQFLKK